MKHVVLMKHEKVSGKFGAMADKTKYPVIEKIFTKKISKDAYYVKISLNKTIMALNKSGSLGYTDGNGDTGDYLAIDWNEDITLYFYFFVTNDDPDIKDKTKRINLDIVFDFKGKPVGNLIWSKNEVWYEGVFLSQEYYKKLKG